MRLNNLRPAEFKRLLSSLRSQLLKLLRVSGTYMPYHQGRRDGGNDAEQRTQVYQRIHRQLTIWALCSFIGQQAGHDGGSRHST